MGPLLNSEIYHLVRGCRWEGFITTFRIDISEGKRRSRGRKEHKDENQVVVMVVEVEVRQVVEKVTQQEKCLSFLSTSVI